MRFPEPPVGPFEPHRLLSHRPLKEQNRLLVKRPSGALGP